MNIIYIFLLLFSCFSCKNKDNVNEFTCKLGKLLVNKNEIKLGHTIWGTKQLDTLIVYNPTSENIQLESVGHPEGIICHQIKGSMADWYLGGIDIPARKKDTLLLGINPTKDDQLGYFYTYIQFMVDGDYHFSQGITLETNVIEDFNSWNEDEKKNAPCITTDTNEFNFGQIPEGEKITITFKIKNTGKSNLLIRKISTSCGCTIATLKERNITPNSTTHLKIEFNSKGRKGLQHKDIIIISNDPKQPLLKLFLNGYVK